MDAPPRVAERSARAEALTPFRLHINITRELAVTAFKLKYTGSVLGYAWSLLKPLMIFGIMYFVFNDLLGTGKGTVDFPLQLLVGVVLWTFFSETTSSAVGSVASNGTLVQRASFPKSILVLATAATASMTFLINISLIVVVAAPLGQLHLGLQSLVAIPLVLELGALTLGVSLLVACLFVFFRDLGHLWDILLQVLFYGSAVVFPIVSTAQRLPLTGGIRLMLLMSPLTQIIEDMRHALVTPRAPWTVQIVGGAGRFLIPIGFVVLTLIAGVVLFRRLAPTFAENL